MRLVPMTRNNWLLLSMTSPSVCACVCFLSSFLVLMLGPNRRDQFELPRSTRPRPFFICDKCNAWIQQKTAMGRSHQWPRSWSWTYMNSREECRRDLHETDEKTSTSHWTDPRRIPSLWMNLLVGSRRENVEQFKCRGRMGLANGQSKHCRCLAF